MVFLANLAFDFHSGISIPTTMIIMATPKMKNNFLAEITKADHELSETYFIKMSYVLAEL